MRNFCRAETSLLKCGLQNNTVHIILLQIADSHKGSQYNRYLTIVPEQGSSADSMLLTQIWSHEIRLSEPFLPIIFFA